MPLEDIKYNVDVTKKRVIIGISVDVNGVICVDIEERYSYKNEILKNIRVQLFYTDAESSGLASQLISFVETKINEINNQDKAALETPANPAP